MTTATLQPENNDALIEVLTEHIHNWRLLLESSWECEDNATIERIQARIREDRAQLHSLQRS